MIKLKPYQREAVDKMHNGCILCGPVGSGKSITALFYYYEKVCGGLLRKNKFIKTQINKRLYIITTARKRDTAEWEKECSNIGLSIKNVVIDSWNNILKYKTVKDSFFIFDEQRVIGSGVWVNSFLKIASCNEWILLTATPGDTWLDYIPVFIANGFYKNRTEFINRHVVYSNFSKFPKVQRYVEVGRLLRLKKEILIAMRYVKQTKTFSTRILVSYDREKYYIILKERWNVFKNCPIRNISEMCFSLRKIVNIAEDRCVKLLNIYKNHGRLIVFYTFDYELNLLKAFCENNNIAYAEWNGHRHEQIPKDVSWIYLVQYSAGSEGWNCVETDTIVFYSQSYSYRAMIQAAGRIDRLNTPFNNLYYYYLISNSSIDRAIEKALSLKKNFNENKHFSFNF